MADRLKDKVAIVTGGASGIGRAGSILMAGEGAKVVVADIDTERANALANEIGNAGGEAIAIRLDVRDTVSVQAMVDAVIEHFGHIDILFHNAVSVPLVNKHDRRITELPEETWDAIVGLVLTGTYLTAKYVARRMLEQKSGSIILTATVDALIGQAGLDAYTAAKGGVISMTRSMAAGLSPEGVRVNAICPGFVKTPHQGVFLDDERERASIEALHLMGIMAPEEVAAFAVFLASDEARSMTGGIHVVDSGYTAFKANVDPASVFKREA
ncbi:MAG: SDR family oxidoreductase [Mesorhizobium sp.]|nr:SDR family oxidoreductase [Mesorhizobium sp.]MBL8578314.1 SDR family oxidoreductase [Mesorhizobium sp.]